jgi:hypothetical protein
LINAGGIAQGFVDGFFEILHEAFDFHVRHRILQAPGRSIGSFTKNDDIMSAQAETILEKRAFAVKIEPRKRKG